MADYAQHISFFSPCQQPPSLLAFAFATHDLSPVSRARPLCTFHSAWMMIYIKRMKKIVFYGFLMIMPLENDFPRMFSQSEEERICGLDISMKRIKTFPPFPPSTATGSKVIVRLQDFVECAPTRLC